LTVFIFSQISNKTIDFDFIYAVRIVLEMSCSKLNKNKIFKLFSAMPDLEMNPLLFKAFSPPSTSHEETSFQRIQPYASLRKSKPPVPPRLGTDPVKRRFGESGLLKDKSEPIYQVSVTYDASAQRAKIQNS
jgi:hypothetical protein